MPSLQILVQYKTLENNKEEVSIHITGAYENLLYIKSKLPKEIQAASIRRSFLICGGIPTLNIYCGPSCIDHKGYTAIINTAIEGFNCSDIRFNNLTPEPFKKSVDVVAVAAPLPEFLPTVAHIPPEKHPNIFSQSEKSKFLGL